MKKLLILPILWIAFFPLLTSADSITDCQNDETCWLCILENQTSCDNEYNCTMIDSSMCDMIEDEWEREQCMADIDSSYQECESNRDSCYANWEISCANQYFPNSWWWSEWWNWWNWWSPIAWWVLNWTQLANMWTALANWWSSLLKIWIQLMPYVIAFTIILLIFGLIKNWSKLKNKWLSNPYEHKCGEKKQYSELLDEFWRNISDYFNHFICIHIYSSLFKFLID